MKSNLCKHSDAASRDTFRRRVRVATCLAAIAGVADAETSPDAEANAGGETLEEVIVMGRDQARTSAAVKRDFIETQVVGVAPLAVLKDIPGVNVQTSDPFALYEHNNRLRIRGFELSQIGQTIDGVPFVNAAEGGHVSRFVVSENLASIQVSPGSGDVTQPALSALGGAIRYNSRDPNDQLGGSVSGTVGRYDMSRVFASVDTGLLGNSGIKGMLSGVRAQVGQFENVRYPNRADHFETKWMKEFGDRGSLAYAFRWDFGDDHDTQNIGLDFEPNRAASGQLNSSITGVADADGFWIGFWRNDRNSKLHSLHGKFELTENLHLSVTPYYAKNFSRIFYGVPAATALNSYNAALTGTPGRTDVTPPNGASAQRDAQRRLERSGMTTALEWDLSAHKVQVGGWYEEGTYEYYQPLNNTDPIDGSIIAYPVIRIDADYAVDTDVLTLYAKDTILLFQERMRLEIGAKGMRIVRALDGYANPQDFNISLVRNAEQTHSDWFQPQAGFSLDITESTQVFINYAENFSAIPQAALASLVYNPNLRPETSRNVDVGFRMQRTNWSGYFSFFGVEYEDRILALSAPTRGIIGSTYLNVNNVETTGAEISTEWRPMPGLRFSSNVSYIDAKYKGDYYSFDSAGNQTILVPVDGNVLPDQPEMVATLSGTWEGDNITTSLDAQYMSTRQADTRNTITVPSYSVLNGSIGYRGDPGTRFENTRFQVSGYNLLDEKYVSSISPSVSSASLKRGYPRSFYFSVSYDF